MTRMPLPSQQELLAHYVYDPQTGILTYKQTGFRMREGEPAARTSKGRVRVRYCGKVFFAHRAIFKMAYDLEPEQVDHIDGNPLNNRLSNLRAATNSQNQANRKTAAHRGLPKGVSRASTGPRFRAMINTNKKYFCLGTFVTVEEARQAYLRKAEELFGEYARCDPYVPSVDQ